MEMAKQGRGGSTGEKVRLVEGIPTGHD